MYSRIETITPKIAAEYLQKNKNNRNLRFSTVRSYARDMKNGKWQLTPQGISFYENGDLADGQHRLAALIRANCPIDFFVTYDVPNESRVLDRGMCRKEADILHFAGFNDNIANNYCVAIVNALFYMVSKKATIGILTDFMEKYGELVWKAARLTQRGGSATTALCRKAPIGAAVFCALYCGVDEEGLVDFFTVANNGLNAQNYVDPTQTSAVVLRNYIVREFTAKNTKDRCDLFRMTCYAMKDFACGNPRAKRYKIDKEPAFWPYVKKQIVDQYVNSYGEK